MAKNNLKNDIDVMIGERVKKCRKDMALSQEELASLVRNLPENNGKERTPQHIGYIERGDRKLSAEWARLLSKVFNVRTEYLLCEDNFKTEFQKKLYKPAMNIYNKFCEEKAVTKYLETFGIEMKLMVEGVDDNIAKLSYEDIEAMSNSEEIITDVISKMIIDDNCKYKITIKRTGEVIKVITAEEYKRFIKDIAEYFEFKFDKLTEE